MKKKTTARRQKQSKRQPRLEDAIQSVRHREPTHTLVGREVEDKNLPGRSLMVVGPAEFYSVRDQDILSRSKDDSGFDVLQVSLDAQIFRTSAAILQADGFHPAEIEMEDYPAPPSPKPRKNDPTPASPSDIVELFNLAPSSKSIAGAAAQYVGSCAGGDAYRNNCAHYLSDAFIRAGYTDLLPPNDCVNARCSTESRRVIRAKDMWCWFQSMAKESRGTLPTKEGYWAVFQLKETEYCCGHVVIIDTDNNKYFGTGNYPHWDQYAYKW